MQNNKTIIGTTMSDLAINHYAQIDIFALKTRQQRNRNKNHWTPSRRCSVPWPTVSSSHKYLKFIHHCPVMTAQWTALTSRHPRNVHAPPNANQRHKTTAKCDNNYCIRQADITNYLLHKHTAIIYWWPTDKARSRIEPHRATSQRSARLGTPDHFDGIDSFVNL